MTIDSEAIITHFDSMIVHLAKTIQIEQECTMDDAISKVRSILARKVLELGENKTADSDKIRSMYLNNVQTGKSTALEKAMYHLLDESGLL